MYRHFAVVTVLITLLIALFADGENRQAMGNELEAQRQQTALRQAEGEKLGPRKLARNDLPRRNGSGWGDDSPVEPEGSGAGGNEVSVRRDTGDIERAGVQDFGTMGPGAALQQAGGTITRTGTITKTRRKPTPQERAKLERAGLDRAAGLNAAPKS